MIDPNKKEHASLNPSDVCHRAFELMHDKQYSDAEKLLVNTMAKTDDDTAVALYHSCLGILFKLQGEYKTAWKHYERAEKLLPNDPALKIISARLLIEQFSECDQAIKKAKKVLMMLPDHPVFVHQAYTTIGLAYIKKGAKRQALESLEKSMHSDFHGFVTAKNVDLALVEGLLRRGGGERACGVFLKKALAFAENNDEEVFVKLFQKLLDAFRADYPAAVSTDDTAS